MFENSQIFKNRPILAIDYAKSQSGLATYHPGKDPYPLGLKNLKAENLREFISKIKEVVFENSIEVIVMGHPLHLDGNSSSMSKNAENIAKMIKNELPHCHIYLQDETLTTFEARDRMKNSPLHNFKVKEEEVDIISAKIILEDFMNSPNLKELL